MEQCPKCNEFKLQKISRWLYFVVTFLTGSCLAIFFIGIPIMILSPLTLLIPTRYHCKNCKARYKPQELSL